MRQTVALTCGGTSSPSIVPDVVPDLIPDVVPDLFPDLVPDPTERKINCSFFFGLCHFFLELLIRFLSFFSFSLRKRFTF